MPAFKYPESPLPDALLVPNAEPQWRFQHQSTLRRLRLAIGEIAGTHQGRYGRKLTWAELQHQLKRYISDPRPWWFEDPMGCCELHVEGHLLGHGSLSFCRAWAAMRDQRAIDVAGRLAPWMRKRFHNADVLPTVSAHWHRANLQRQEEPHVKNSTSIWAAIKAAILRPAPPTPEGDRRVAEWLAASSRQNDNVAMPAPRPPSGMVISAEVLAAVSAPTTQPDVFGRQLTAAFPRTSPAVLPPDVVTRTQ